MSTCAEPMYLSAALALHARGFKVTLPDPESKGPNYPGWGTRKLTESDIRGLLHDDPSRGVGIRVGPGAAPDGGWLIDLEGDGPAAADSLLTLMGGEEPDTRGWRSSRGDHRLFLVDPERFAPLVRALNSGRVVDHFVLPMLPDLEFRVGGDGKQTQCVAPPTIGSDGRPREWFGPDDIAELPLVAYELLERLAAALDPGGRPAPAARLAPGAGGDQRPGDAFNAEGTWEFVLEPAGFRKVGVRGETTHWTRPGKGRGTSATTGFNGADLLFVYSTNAPLPAGVWMTKFEAYTRLNYGEDWSEAARALRRAGFGGGSGSRPPVLTWPPATDGGPSAGGAGGETDPDHDQGDGGGPAAAHEPGPDRDEGPHEAVDDPHRLARLYRDRRCVHPGSGALTVRYYQGEFYRYAGAYSRVTDQELRAELGGVVKAELDHANVRAIEEWSKNGECDKVTGKPARKPVAGKVTEPLKNNTLGNLASLTLVKAGDVPSLPAWLDGPGPWPAAEVLPAPNGLFHLPSLANGCDGFVIDPTPRYFSTFQLGYDVDVNAPEPTHWLQFLGAKPLDPGGRIKQQLWPDPANADVIAALQEWIGLQLVADTSYQKIAALIGPKRSGKGTIARILTAMVGAANVAGPTLSGLAGNFGLEPLVGKLVAIIDDARLSSRSDAAIITERLLTISGEGTLTVDQKHRPAWTGKLPTRITMLSNELPRLDDASAALAGRLIIIPFRESFYGKEDRGLDGVLLAELPGILLWAIEGWRRLRERGHLVQPKAGEQLAKQMAHLSSPVSQFIEEECELDPRQRISCADLFLAWQVWCERNGQKRPGTAQTFGRNLAAAYPGIKVVHPREDGGRVRYYEGVYGK